MTAPAAAYTPIHLFCSTIEEPHGKRIELATHRDRAGTPFLDVTLRDDGRGHVAIPMAEALLADLVALLGAHLFDGALMPEE